MNRETSPEFKSVNYSLHNDVGKIIALWGFSEATLGGILHALNIPFTGLFVGSTAVLLITLIAAFSNQRGAILRATLIVLSIKGIVSPHTPLTAYAAVLLQGIIGQLLFTFIKQHKLAAFILAVTAMLLSALQKLIILTVVFGNTLWDSIDIYSSFVINQFMSPAKGETTFQLSYLLMGIYIGIHLVTGILAGILAGKLNKWIEEGKTSAQLSSIIDQLEEIKNNKKEKGKKRSWWRKKSGIFFILMMIIMLVLSYLYPEFGTGNVSSIFVMLIRSTVIMIVWFFLLSPLLLKLFRKYISKQQKSYANEIEGIIVFFPHIRSIIKSSWDNSKKAKNLQRVKSFLSTSLVLLLITEMEE